jgi:glutamate-1-semialdehyde 2,1-aminomutase
MRYKKSLEHFDRAISVIPTASQTFSKSHYSLPKGAAPLFIERGQGSCVWDIDGNKYIDLVNGLLSVSLGYCDPDVDNAILQQLKNGINFSLPHKLEAEVAEKIVELIPCAEMVRFGKNGTDVTSAAIRLARAYTNKDDIAVCGYHGWQDWYIGSTSRNLGVPECVSALTHTFKYNDIESLEMLFKNNSNLGAVILEPMSTEYPKNEFLKKVRVLCDQYNAILIFDEMITGFRFHIGGAQTLFDVIPDLATFGKGMANGMPISAVVGKFKIMNKMEDIFFSGTFGGETLSLAAANSTINKMVINDVQATLRKIGEYLFDGIEEVIKVLSINWFSLKGHPTWKVMQFSCGDEDLLYKSVLLQLLLERGVLSIGSLNVSYSLTYIQADLVITAFHSSLELINNNRMTSCVDSLLTGELLEPVFKVR